MPSKKRKQAYGPKAQEYKLTHPEKYTGKFPVICRSSLERKAIYSMDMNAAIHSWGSESVVIKYYNPVKKRSARYFMDLDFVALDHTGKSQRYLIEVKPECQTHTPSRGRKKEKTFITEACNWAVNLAKWRATYKLCEAKGWRFALWTERGMRIWKEEV